MSWGWEPSRQYKQNTTSSAASECGKPRANRLCTVHAGYVPPCTPSTSQSQSQRPPPPCTPVTQNRHSRARQRGSRVDDAMPGCPANLISGYAIRYGRTRSVSLSHRSIPQQVPYAISPPPRSTSLLRRPAPSVLRSPDPESLGRVTCTRT